MPDRAFDSLMDVLGGGFPEPVELYGGDIEAKLRAAPPAIVKLDGHWTALREIRGNRALVVHPDGFRQRIPFSELVNRLCREKIEPRRADVEELLAGCGIAPSRFERAFRILALERIADEHVGTLYQVRTNPGSSFGTQLREAGAARSAAALVFAHAAEYVLWLAGWWVLGAHALQGRVEGGWLAAWALLLFSAIPFRMLGAWMRGSVWIAVGGLLRERLLAGALQLTPEEVKLEGAGSFLGRAIEAESIESLALGGGISGGLALIELMLAIAVLCAAPGAAVLVPLLLCWMAVIGFLAWRYWQSRQRWTTARLRMTHELIERMTGHRTRLAQQPGSAWHEEEDRAVNGYLSLSAAMDGCTARLGSLAPRAWLVFGIAALMPTFVNGGSGSPAGLPLALGGVLLASQALRRLVSGVLQLAGAAIAWRQVAKLFHAAAREHDRERPRSGSGDLIIDADNVSFRHDQRADPALSSISLRVRRGDWILLEGESGGGKSTLAALLAGLRQPAAGLLLRWGDVACAPQYHENHVLTGTFAFNLLMGRMWPPSAKDVNEAEEVARELGLGQLLDRMPGGMAQMIGETGWQLSHGERSRLFLARALLQNADLTILDESFAALDPENLRLSLECALKRARSVLVAAHP
jgi:ATP-binding cassette, subfamily B, bacterial